MASTAGFRCFPDIDTFLDYVSKEVLETPLGEADEHSPEKRKPQIIPASFHDAIIEEIEERLGCRLVRQGRARWRSPDSQVAVFCSVSRAYARQEGETFWFIVKPFHLEFLETAGTSYLAFGCGAPEKVVLIPSGGFLPWLEGFNTTETENGPYWHVHVDDEHGRLRLRRKRGIHPIEIDQYIL